MKVRFSRTSYVAYVASEIHVHTVEELYEAIRKEKCLPKDFDFTNKIITNPSDHDDPAFERRYQIFMVDVGVIGFCDGPLSDIQEKRKEPIPQGPYRIDTDRAEHKCCWNSAIVRPPTEQEKKAGLKRDIRILECSKENARLIRDALNAYHTLNKKA